ncbi:glycosyltransferase [Flavobacterium sp. 3HN19-14]|uniref:glycosyltransferase n=1 Tax=Flavobacterium sp. 3HN19-14 TaxID=3448133 RepID=UPI003EDF4753
MFDHYLMTRFNLRYKKWEFTKNNESLLTDEWMEDRMWLFESFCFPSVISQTNKNFKWLLFFDITTTEKFRARIENLIKPYDFIELYYVDGMPSFIPEIVNIIEGRKQNPYVITTRIDNDDTIHRNFIDEVQKQFDSQDFRVIDIAAGYSLNLNPWMLGKKEQLFNPFVSLIEKHDQPKTVWSTAHNIWKKENRITRISDKRLWLSIIHQKNKVNEFDGYGDVKWNDIKADFIVSDEVSALISQNQLPLKKWWFLGLKNKISIKSTVFSKNFKRALGIYKFKK